MSKRPDTTTHDYLINAALPPATDTYTVIPHESVINKVREAFLKKGITIEREIYRCNTDAQIAQGVYHLIYGADTDLGMLFAWSNSYDKSMRFKCSIGGYVHASLASVIAGNMATWGRKHTGTADDEAFLTIDEQINNAEQYFKELVDAKNIMINTSVTEEQRARFVGELYFINELVTNEQISLIRQEFNKPSFQYSGNGSSVWEMYNAIILSLQKSHPKTWMDQQRMIHYALCKEFNINANIIPQETEFVDPNQLSLIEEFKDVHQEQQEDMLAQDKMAEHDVIDENPSEYLSPFAGDPPLQTPEEREIELASEPKGSDHVPSTTENSTEGAPWHKDQPMITPVEFINVSEADFKTGVVDINHISPEIQQVLLDVEKDLIFEGRAVVTIAEEPSTTVEDDTWPCMKCGEQQGSTAVFHDGQLCSKCVNT